MICRSKIFHLLALFPRRRNSFVSFVKFQCTFIYIHPFLQYTLISQKYFPLCDVDDDEQTDYTNEKSDNERERERILCRVFNLKHLLCIPKNLIR